MKSCRKIIIHAIQEVSTEYNRYNPDTAPICRIDEFSPDKRHPHNEFNEKSRYQKYSRTGKCEICEYSRKQLLCICIFMMAQIKRLPRIFKNRDKQHNRKS